MRKMKFFFKWHWPLCVIRRSPLQGQNQARDRGGCVGGSPYEGPALLGPAPTAGPTPMLHLPHQLGLTKPGHRQCERRKGTFLQSEVENKSQKGSSVSRQRLEPDHLHVRECYACHLLVWALLSCSHPELPFPHLQNRAPETEGGGDGSTLIAQVPSARSVPCAWSVLLFFTPPSS